MDARRTFVSPTPTDEPPKTCIFLPPHDPSFSPLVLLEYLSMVNYYLLFLVGKLICLPPCVHVYGLPLFNNRFSYTCPPLVCYGQAERARCSFPLSRRNEPIVGRTDSSGGSVGASFFFFFRFLTLLYILPSSPTCLFSPPLPRPSGHLGPS